MDVTDGAGTGVLGTGTAAGVADVDSLHTRDACAVCDMHAHGLHIHRQHLHFCDDVVVLRASQCVWTCNEVSE